MAVMSFEACRPHLEPVAEILVPTLEEANQSLLALLNSQPELQSVFDSSTQASMLSNMFASMARPRLASIGIDWKQHGKMQAGSVNGVINLRFKKLATDLHSMNIATETQTKIYHQWTLPGMVDMTQVTFGYVRDPAGMSIAGAFFICPKSWNSNFWSWPLFGSDGTLSLFEGIPSPANPSVFDPDLDVGVSMNEKNVEKA